MPGKKETSSLRTGGGVGKGSYVLKETISLNTVPAAGRLNTPSLSLLSFSFHWHALWQLCMSTATRQAVWLSLLMWTFVHQSEAIIPHDHSDGNVVGMTKEWHLFGTIISDGKYLPFWTRNVARQAVPPITILRQRVQRLPQQSIAGHKNR